MKMLVKLVVAFSYVVSLGAYAATPWSSLDEPVAIQGYDTVAYFTNNEAMRGSSNYVYDWSGKTWLFATVEHRDAFAASPEKYAPQFGGFCSLSVAYGKNARGGGDAWTIHEGKLYLNYDQKVRADFLQNLQSNISKAEGWWPTIKSRIEKQ